MVYLLQAEPPAEAIPPMTDAEIIRHLGSYLFSPENPEYRCAAGPRCGVTAHFIGLALTQQVVLILVFVTRISLASAFGLAPAHQGRALCQAANIAVLQGSCTH